MKTNSMAYQPAGEKRESGRLKTGLLDENGSLSYGVFQLLVLILLAAGVWIASGLLGAETAYLVQWGFFWGFAFSFSLILSGRIILNPVLFVFSLIRILFFGYCMGVTAGFDHYKTLLVLAGFLGYGVALLVAKLLTLVALRKF